MARVRRLFLAFGIAVLTVIALASPARAATSREETGPLMPHVPKTYVYDLSTRELTNKETGEHIAWGFDDGKCPILQKDDAVEVIPEPSVINEHVGKGFVLVANAHFPGATGYESRGPLEVTDTQTWGGATYITGFKNADDTPVFVWSNGGGDHSAEQVSEDKWYAYTRADLDFMYYPSSVEVKYEYRDTGDGHLMGEGELQTLAWYTDGQNPTLFWSDDALANRYGANDTVDGLDVHRPYLEGYSFGGYSGDQYRRGDGEGERVDLSQIYGYRFEEVDAERNARFYPQWWASIYNNQVLNGSSDDAVYITFKFDRGRTITLDANGGTIEGYPARIYEVNGPDPESQMDEDFAQGAYTPVREGYVFCGWCEDEACTVALTSFHDLLSRVSWPVAYTYPLEERALRVYAKWKPENPFLDVTPSTSHYEDILWLADEGISTGWTNKEDDTREFRPNAPIARGDMAAFLFRLAKRWDLVDENWKPRGTYNFVDVTDKTSHRIEILWMAESGISTGWSTAKGAEFRPNDPVKRGQMAAFMQRMAVKVAGRKGGASSPESFFRDVTGSTSFHDEIWWLAGNGVTQGWGSGAAREYRPNANVARGDMAAFLHRLDGVK